MTTEDDFKETVPSILEHIFVSSVFHIYLSFTKTLFTFVRFSDLLVQI